VGGGAGGIALRVTWFFFRPLVDSAVSFTQSPVTSHCHCQRFTDGLLTVAHFNLFRVGTVSELFDSDTNL